MDHVSTPPSLEQQPQHEVPSFAPVPLVHAEDAQILLDGPLERHRFAPWLMALVVSVLGWIGMQVIGAIGFIVLLLAEGLPPDELMTALTTEIGSYIGSFMLANTIAQVLGLALPIWLITRLHTRQVAAFLRLRGTTLRAMALSMVGWVVLYPLLQWLGSVNSLLPLPEWWVEMEAMQMGIIEQVISREGSLVFNLFVLALTPAICEELMFRGYLQRQLERVARPFTMMVVIGLVFGVFHLRLAQVLPLAFLGGYLAFLTWRTGSLWPAVVVHLLNNAFAVGVGSYVASQEGLSLTDLETVGMPWYLVGLSAVLFTLVVRSFRKSDASQPISSTG